MGNEVRFLLTLTQPIHPPRVAPEAKPELFNFEFVQFTSERGPGNGGAVLNVPNSSFQFMQPNLIA